MIVRVYNDEDCTSFHSNGCGCCSVEYNPSVEYWKQQEEWGLFPFDDKTPEQVAEEHHQRIIEHLKRNVEVTKEALEELGIDFETFIKGINEINGT